MEDRSEHVLLTIADHPDPPTSRGLEIVKNPIEYLLFRGERFVEADTRDRAKERGDTQRPEHLVSEIHPLGRRDTHEHITLFEHSQRFKDAVIEPGPLDAEFSVEVAVPIDDRTEGVPVYTQSAKGLFQRGSDQLAQVVVASLDAQFVQRQSKGVQNPLLGVGDGPVKVKDHVLGQRTHSTILTRFLPTRSTSISPLGRMKFRNRMRPQRLASTSTFSTTNTPSSLIDHLRKAWDIDARPPSSMNPYASAWPAKSL